jgi:glycogen debranching enzyme
MKSSRNQPLGPVTMEEAVGYPSIACDFQTPIEHALVLKHDRCFFIANPHGDIAPPGHCSLGLFQDDTRILSQYQLRVRGGSPSLLGVQVPQSYIGHVDLAIKDAEFGGDSWDPKNCIHLRRELLVSDRLIERLTLTNYLQRSIEYWIELSLGCDFADIFEVRGWKREKRGQFFAPRVQDGMLVAAYQGLDGAMLQTVVRFREPPDQLHPKGARWQFDFPPKAHYELEWQVYSENAPPARLSWTGFRIDEHRKKLDEAYSRWTSQCTQWSSSSAEFEAVLNRAVDDLHALYVCANSVPVISAGIPWYSTVFGRDSIITSLETLPLNPRIAMDTLRYLARHQGVTDNPETEEQPGKIMHELRRGEMARNGEIPHVPYYGTIDATPLWLVLLHETWRWTGDEPLVRDLLPHAERALNWIHQHGDLDGDGLVEYAGSASKKGLANQGWKDSGDGVPYPDGSLPEPPIALVEVQGYVYDALARSADLFGAFGEKERSESLKKQAADLREQIIRHFWMEELGMFALALGGDKEVIPTITSNAGHLLWSAVPYPAQAASVAKHLTGADMFSGWGIRTLSAGHSVYNPMSYHNGSIWPHDNALIVLGMARYGFSQLALPVVRGLHDAAAADEFQRVPELFCGMTRTPGMHPVSYPVSCSPQAWASASFFMLLQAVLGIHPDAPAGLLRIRNPILPDFLEELTITGLAVGNSIVSLQFRKFRDRTFANLLSVSGDALQVTIELA